MSHMILVYKNIQLITLMFFINHMNTKGNIAYMSEQIMTEFSFFDEVCL